MYLNKKDKDIILTALVDLIERKCFDDEDEIKFNTDEIKATLIKIRDNRRI